MRKVIFVGTLFVLITATVQAQTGSPSATASPSIMADQLARLERAENRLKDWPSLGRYREANAKPLTEQAINVALKGKQKNRSCPEIAL